MRPITALLLAAALVVGGCSGGDAPASDSAGVGATESGVDAPSESASDASEDGQDPAADATLDDLESIGDVEVDRGLLNVEITIPASFFEGEDPDDIIASAREQGIDRVTVNDDGSVTYRMTRAQHRALMNDMRESMTEGFAELSQDFPSVQQIEHNDALTRFALTVDRNAWENSFDSFALFGIAIGAGFYHLFDGTDPDDLRITVEVVDHETAEVFDTIIIPDDWEDW